ncbi:hypothetical protein M514_26376 [Trichuris suis]|uniref:Uncharacterized protein n=1 Tax=Trichuris suis TaxID=68888 RepID=A0A085MW84_9BILA|nr:hypothetical protein M514_26376 [Trichuris suis]
MKDGLSAILLVCGYEAMIKRDRRGHSYCCVRGSKVIRYRPSCDRKRCQPAIRRRSFYDSLSSFRETKVFQFRGKYGCKAET